MLEIDAYNATLGLGFRTENYTLNSTLVNNTSI